MIPIPLRRPQFLRTAWRRKLTDSGLVSQETGAAPGEKWNWVRPSEAAEKKDAFFTTKTG